MSSTVVDDFRHRYREPLLRAIHGAEVAQAQGLLRAAMREASAREVLAEILEPVLVAVGESWNVRAMALAQGYLAAKLAEEVLEQVVADSRAHPPEDLPAANRYGPVVLGNIEDDFHALGRRMVGLFLMGAGWSVVDLGNDVPPADFVARAREVGARVIGASAMM